jgi:hypothetical protein
MRSSGNGDNWNVEIDAPSRKVKSYFEESLIAAEMVYEKRQGQMHITYSGGLDSEYALSLFLRLGIPITPVIMNMTLPDGTNNNIETKYAYEFCESKKLSPKIVDLNFKEFVDSGKLLDICLTAECCRPELAASFWLAEQLDGTVVTGNDPPHMKLNKEDNLWYLDEEEFIHSQFIYWRKKNMEGTPFLLSYTSEMMLAFLIDPTIEQLANHAFPGKLGTNSSKVHVFNKGSDFNLVQRTKRTGYEDFYEHDFFNHPDIQTVLSWKDKWFGTSDHQYHKVVERLSNGISSKEFMISPERV